MNTKERTITVECNDVQFRKIEQSIRKIIGKRRRNAFKNVYEAYSETVLDLLEAKYNAPEIEEYLDAVRETGMPKANMKHVYVMIAKHGYKMAYVKQV